MNRILLVLLLGLALGPLAQGPPAQAQVARDTLDASVAYFTARIDSVQDLTGGTPAMRADTTFQADPRTGLGGATVAQLQIDVHISLGRSDTIILKKAVIVAHPGNRYDTLWRPVSMMRLSDASVDTMGIVALGPIGSMHGGSYRVESFLVYDAFMDGRPWRIERRSGKGHPILPDASATHLLFFEYYRRVGAR